jgi:hypothetical protein
MKNDFYLDWRNMMSESYIIEATDKNGYGYEWYNGTDKDEAEKLYNEYKNGERKYYRIEFYKKTVLGIINNATT